MPFEHNEPDATYALADTLASWRRATADGEKQPKAPVPWEGEAVEYEPVEKAADDMDVDTGMGAGALKQPVTPS